VGHVLGPRFKLSSLNARCAPPGTAPVQPLHVDAGALPDERGAWVCNGLWMLDDFTSENGALRAVPGSHRWGCRPQDVLTDPRAPHPGEELVTGRAGDLVVMNAHLWHGAAANRSRTPRLALHAFYCRWDRPQQQHQKALLRPETQAALSPAARELLAIDDPGNDALAARETGTSGFIR
jgi:ectoine hydroxylase-related dioxygenase (phytanoyl-CoA dioxygenase family)